MLMSRCHFFSLSNKHKIILLLGVSLLNLQLMHHYVINVVYSQFTGNTIEQPDPTSYFDNLFYSVIDCLTIFLFFHLISGWRIKLSLLFVNLTTISWAFSNTLYSRFFNHYITYSVLNEYSALKDGMVIESVISGINLYDLTYLMSFILFIIIYRNTKEKKSKLPPIRHCALITMIMIISSISAHIFYCISNKETRYLKYIEKRLYKIQISSEPYLYESTLPTFDRGVIRSLLTGYFLSYQVSIKLTSSQLESIHTAIKKSTMSLTNHKLDTKPRNVIFILVESYMSFTSDLLINGKEITPFLNSIKNDSNVYYNGHVKPNITIGASADGQFIYLTGLLPLRSTLTISVANKIKLIGLPKILHTKMGLYPRMIIPTAESIWNQRQMCTQYGIPTLYSRSDVKEVNKSMLSDEQVFNLAKKIDNENTSPFFSIILTASMHEPYNKDIDPEFSIQDPSYKNDLKHYLNACHYTDKQIKEYFDFLKDNGIYDKSLIIIASDHNVKNANWANISNDLPLYIINGDINNSNSWKGQCNQVDIYTTLLDILGIKQQWNGLGNSLLSRFYKNSLTPNKWIISENIMRSNYLEKGLKSENR